MSQRRVVGIAQMVICRAPDQLACLGLGSCVAVIVYDPSTKIGGIVHVLLSKAPTKCNDPEKYADTGTRKLVSEMILKGAKKEKLVAKLVGGAQMFSRLNLSIADIGRLNLEVARRTLRELGVPVVASDIGGTHGRSAIMDTLTGKVTIEAAFSPVRVI